jgi:hypothetical protein
MSTQKLWAQPIAAPAMTKDELRQRILAVVGDRKQTTEAEIWNADAPNFLPWDSMIEEIKLLDHEQKLRREIVAPGHIVIHAVKTPPAIKSNPGKPTRRSGKPTKKTDPEPQPSR